MSVAPLYAGETLKEAFEEGAPYIDVRYRYEHVEQDGLAQDADASTVRTRLGYKSGLFHDFMGQLELENIAQVGDDNYNDTINGKTNRPVVADVENTEVNQVFLAYSGIPDTTLKSGRQVIALDGHRFIGHVGWRQNNQTFDGFTMLNKTIPDTEARYGYIWQVNRIFGDDSPVGDWESDSHFYNISNKSTPLGKITAYGYLLDFKKDAPGVSSQTYGISLDGHKAVHEDITFKYYGEYAYQADFAKNGTDYNAHYYHIAPALALKGFSVTAGYEVLGSDERRIAFSTPLATLHKFNGWADVFLTTPAAGLEDIYADVSCAVSGLEDNWGFFNGLTASVQYHDFSAEDGGADYGSEWGIYLKQPINKNMYVELKYADYNSDGFATDREKITLGFGVIY
jgi:hypothetical protein